VSLAPLRNRKRKQPPKYNYIKPDLSEPFYYYALELLPRTEYLFKKQQKNEYTGPRIVKICLKNTTLSESEIITLVLEKRGLIVDGTIEWIHAFSESSKTAEELNDCRNWTIVSTRDMNARHMKMGCFNASLSTYAY
jgi:hypothetical protein